MEAFEVVYRWEVLRWVGQGDKFAVDAVPVAEGWGGCRVLGHVGVETGLGGGVGAWVGGTVGEDGCFRHFEGGIGAQVVESAPDGGGLDGDGVTAKAVVVRKSSFESPVDE